MFSLKQVHITQISIASFASRNGACYTMRIGSTINDGVERQRGRGGSCSRVKCKGHRHIILPPLPMKDNFIRKMNILTFNFHYY